jgi:hypothetical protein
VDFGYIGGGRPLADIGERTHQRSSRRWLASTWSGPPFAVLPAIGPILDRHAPLRQESGNACGPLTGRD